MRIALKLLYSSAMSIAAICMLRHQVEACIETKRYYRFADFARRAQTIVIATALNSSETNETLSQYNATFKVAGLLPHKSGNMVRGDVITVGPFGKAWPCVPIKPGSHYILFLWKRSRITKQEKEEYSMQFNPVPYSPIVARFYRQVLSRKISGRIYMQSGCKQILRPNNGNVQCTARRDKCRVVCNKGYKRKGSRMRLCIVRIMSWYPKGVTECLPRSKPKRQQVPTLRRMPAGTVKRVKKTWRPLRQRQQALHEEEEQEDKEALGPNRLIKKPPKKPPLKNVSPVLPLSSSINRNITFAETNAIKEVTKPLTTTSVVRSTISDSTETVKSTDSAAKAKSTPFTEKQVTATSLFENITTTTTSVISGEKITTTTTTMQESQASNLSHRGNPQITKLATEGELKGDNLTPQKIRAKTPDLTRIREDLPMDSQAGNRLPNSMETNGSSSVETSNHSTPTQRLNIQPSGDMWSNSDGTIHRPLAGFGDTVVGCPTYNGSVTINSVWPGGFGGYARFQPVIEPLMDGWVVRLVFNIAVDVLETYTVEQFAISNSSREFCLTPKHYAVQLYQDLTVSFVGKVASLPAESAVLGVSELLGVCRSMDIRQRTIGLFTPFDATNSTMEEGWRSPITDFPFAVAAREMGLMENFRPAPTTTTTTSPSITTLQLSSSQSSTSTAVVAGIIVQPTNITSEMFMAGRCSKDTPNGLTPDGGQTQPTWRQNASAGLDYNEILHKSILFYEAQRSGRLGENRIPWRTDSDLKDGCSIEGKPDLSGGWYNSGGNVKTTSLIAFTSTLLSWGGIEYMEAYESAGEKENLLKQVKWATDYLMKCRVSSDELVVQIGDFVQPRDSWSPPEGSNPDQRTVYKADPLNPAADVAADVSAALASASILFRDTDPMYAAACLGNASELYQVARRHPTAYTSDIRSPQWIQPDNGIDDDMAWAEVWLFQATNNNTYLSQAEERYFDLDQTKNLFYWGDKIRGIDVILSKIGTFKSIYRTTVTSYIRWLQDRNIIQYTPSGLIWFDRIGTTMYAANAAFLTLQAVNFTTDLREAFSYYQFAKSQMEALVGRSGQGFVVGIGENSPQRPQHRGSSCPGYPSVCLTSAFESRRPNPHRLYGALVNGPGRKGAFNDGRGFVQNEVSITYNAAFQSLAAGLKQISNNTWVRSLQSLAT